MEKSVRLFSYSKIHKGKKIYKNRCKICTRIVHRGLSQLYRNRKENKEKIRFNDLRKGAKRRNIPFNLTLEEYSSIKKPKYCPVLGLRLQYHTKKHKPNSYSIDRIDHTKGYQFDNLRIISHRANSLLRDATLEELRKIYKYKKKYG